MSSATLLRRVCLDAETVAQNIFDDYKRKVGELILEEDTYVTWRKLTNLCKSYLLFDQNTEIYRGGFHATLAESPGNCCGGRMGVYTNKCFGKTAILKESANFATDGCGTGCAQPSRGRYSTQ